MSRSPWLAIDAAVPPALRARELRQEWEQFVSGGAVNGVRAPVADSWRRSLDAGVDPSGSRLAPVAAGRDEALERWERHPLAEAAPLIRACLAGIARATNHLIVVSDAAGLLLQLEGDARVRSEAADSMNFTEGAQWSEEGAGTNAIGTALAADHAVQIFATEHFIEPVQAWTCSAAPVHDPETGELLGVIDLTGLQKDVHPHSLPVAVTTARAVEGHLLYRLQERDDRLRRRYGRHTTGHDGRQALVSPAGRLIADDARGWLHDLQVDVPPGGGELVLPSGATAFAEPVGHEEAFVVRELDGRGARPRSPGDELRMLAEEQAALRRLATAVAQDVAPAEIFTAVTEEVAPLLGGDEAALFQFQPGHTATVVAGMGPWLEAVGVGERVELDERLAITEVFRTGRPVRMDRHDCEGSTGSGPLLDYLRRAHYRSMVASPITVEGSLWGALVVATASEPLPADTEGRMANFTELVRIVIATAKSRAELSASRARVVAAGDEARRRIQRDLHDGAQQRLVSTIVTLKTARQALDGATGPVAELVEAALTHAEDANRDLRELVRGIMPAALSHGGLRAGIGALVSSIDLPVSVEVTGERLPAALEANAYFIVAEALTNVVRHARATSAQILAVLEGGVLRLEVRDDGVGGAQTDEGSGLVGLRDRAAALDGELRIDSPVDGGTAVTAALPVQALEAA